MNIIMLIIFIQGLYDFLGWYIWLGEPDYNNWKPYFFRVLKEILDFPVTIYLMISLGLPVNLIIGFYVAKWFHGCDSVYNMLYFVLKNEGVDEWGNWRWWTPIGLWRCLQIRRQSGKWHKSEVSIPECWIQTAIGLILAYLINEFKIINFLL